TAPVPARQRRDWVLRRMAATGFVDAAAADAAASRPLVVHPLPPPPQRAPWFAAAMAAEARNRFGVQRLGGTGHTLLSTLSATDQAVAEEEVRGGLDELASTWERGARGGDLQAALVSLEPTSGRILAWVGGRDFHRSEFDRVTQ